MSRPRLFETIGVGMVALGLVAAPALGTAPPSTARAADVEVLRSDFESGTYAPWTPSGSPTLTLVPDPDGTGTSLRVAGRTAGWQGVALDLVPLLEPGATYTVSMRARLADEAQPAAGVHFTVDAPAASNPYTWVSGPSTLSAGAWTTISGSYTFEEGLDAARMYLDGGDTAPYPDLLLDDVVITGQAPTDPGGVVPGGAVDPTTTPVATARGTGDVSALTFDDGPNGATTTALLDFLAERDIRATFCVIGQNIQAPGGADVLRRIVADGHTLCNHTTSYADMGGWTAEQVRADLVENLGIIRDALGDPDAKVPYFRAPNGSWGVTPGVAVALGMQPLAVTNTIDDWSTQDVPTLTSNLRDAMKAGQVVLAHDGGGDRSGTLAAVQTVVDERLAAGWTFTLPTGGADGGSSVPTGLSNDFEAGLGVWGPRGDATVTLSDDAHGGAQAALVAGRTQAWHGIGATVTDVFQTGRTYTVDAWVKLAAGATEPADLRISVQRDNAGESTYDTVTTATGVTADAWTHVQAQYTMAAAESALLYVESSSSLASFLVDDVVVSGSTAPPVQTDIPSLKDELPWPVGVAIDERETVGTGEQLVVKHYDQITAENAMKPESIQPTEGAFTFEAGDALIDSAVANGQRVYGHTLVWHSQTPDWFFTHADGTPLTSSAADQQILRDRMRTHIETVADHYRQKYGEYGTAGNPIVAYDVVNEAIAESESDGLRRSRWFEVLGEQYLDLAFQYASQAFNGGDTDGPVQLFLNDYNTELPAKRQAMLDVVNRLLARDVPLDGLGHQFHVNLLQPVSQMKASIDAFATTGLLQAVTELDAPIDGTVSQEKLVAQGYYYADVFDMLRQYPDLFSVTLWGPYDSRSWREGAPLPFDDDLQAKPAFWGIVDRGELPTLTRLADAHAGTPTGVDDPTWRLLPETSFGDATGFQLRWSADGLVAYVEVADATDDGADDVVDLFAADQHVTVHRSDAGVVATASGYRLAVPLAVAGLTQGGTVPFDVRVTDGASGERRSWNDLSHGQEDGERLGVVTLVEPVGYVAAVQASTAPVIDGVVDEAWADAPVLTTDVQVEGTPGATAEIRVLWHDDAVDVLATVADPVVDETATNAWEQDSVEIFVDPVNAKAGAYTPQDGQYRISASNAQSVSGDLAVIGERLTSATALVDGGYVVEASIALGRDVTVGDLVGLDFQVNDATAGVRGSVRTWTDPTGRSYQSTARWGVAELVAPAVEPGPVLTLGAGSVAAGKKLAVDLAGFEPKAKVRLVLDRVGAAPTAPSRSGLFGQLVDGLSAWYWKDVELGSVRTDADGAASATVKVPAWVLPGDFEVKAYVAGEVVASAPVRVRPVFS
ncbi:Endo-1,4-beta-xylanase [Cellulomonas fimi ATCC 484]|uniref:Beta-xylanase n=2 Tax=Cellulomonas fimi TaxID=1708 RepID=F4GY46_CELFA|nr:Endo-1,4-beta-xylanase [Cellulomonas fimi ATCC 484]VEH27086.1 Endo-1,4-beta-xylanase A precursor [Cellulomonas fimi]